MEMNIEGSTRKLRLKKRWLDTIMSDMRTADIFVDDMRDCIKEV